jgi:hypothetical protein
VAGFDKILNRKKQIDEAVEEPKSTPTPTAKKAEEPAQEPAKRKTFSDGIEREWDDTSQQWVPLNPGGFQKAKP